MDKEKYLEIISEHQNLIYKIYNSYCPNPELRKDLEQEILLQLWNSLKSFDGRVKITTWIYRVALNTAISHYRKDCKRIDKATLNEDSIFSFPDIEYDSLVDEKIAILYKLIENMSSLDKALILLYLDDYKHSEISEIVGLKESNVATKICRIKKQLKEQFSNY